MKKFQVLMCALLVVSLLAIPMVGCAKPVSLSVWEPKDGAIITESPVVVKGYVSDPKATVWINDYVVILTKHPRTATFTTTFDLSEGENVIKVTAAQGKEGKWKNVVVRTVTVTYQPEQEPEAT